MRNTTLLLVCLLIQQMSVLGQTKSPYRIEFKTAPYTPDDKIDQKRIDTINEALKEGSVTAILQFHRIPSSKQKATLSGLGMRLLNYLGGRAYVVKADKTISGLQLQKAGIRWLEPIQPRQKIHPALNVLSSQQLTVHVSLFPLLEKNRVVMLLQENGFTAKTVYGDAPVIEVVVPPGKLLALASMPFIEFIDTPPPPPVELNEKSKAATKANVLQSADYGLTGEGVVMQISEFNSYPQGHLDFIDRSVLGQTQSFSNYHSTHVTGIAAGAGLIDERYKGYAPKARFFSVGPFTPSEANILSYGIDLANHSYGAGVGCASLSRVNSTNSSWLEKMALDFPHLLNVYAAGNYGGNQCDLYPPGYNTIDVNSQTSKAVLTVGSADPSGLLAAYSSKGPVYGGRLKPEVIAPGSLIWSTVPNNSYYTNNGTSMAAPAATGGLALLYQRYGQLHSGEKPGNALMKALLCNTATDKGPVGPDYGYGFGLMNLSRAIQVLDAGAYFNDSVTQEEVKGKNITVPAGTAQLKVMLYWNDRPGSPLTRKLIINDLDLKVTTPQATTILPYILDTIPSLVANAATRGEDHLNNMEQVVIDHPQAGIYGIHVKGFEVMEGSEQNYYVVYDVVPDAVQFTYPSAGQALVPGETVKLQWDNWGGQATALKLEFSADSGATWQTVHSAIAAGSNGYEWTVPQVATARALFRLTRNDDGKTAVSGRFTIVGVPAFQLSASQCPGAIALDWSAVPGATGYEVMWYKGGEMVTAGTTTQTRYVLRNLSEDSTYWVSVRARYNEEAGRRAVALSRKPDSGNCADSIYDGDLKMDALLSPLFGRQFTSRQLGLETIRVRLKNLDNLPASGFTVGYAVNNGAWTNGTVTSALSATAAGVYSFVAPFDFSRTGDYAIQLAVHGNGDTNPANDTLRFVIRHLANDPVSAETAIIDDMEGAARMDYRTGTFGLTGLDRFDYSKTASPSERLRVGSHFQQDTTTALELTYTSPANEPAQPHALTATYNLSQFDTAQHSVSLDFSYVHVSPGLLSTDSLLVRGSDTAQWIYMENLFRNVASNGKRDVQGIALGDSLRVHRQNFSSSVQVKWAPSPTGSAILLDNIKLYNASNDLAVASIDSLSPANCGLSAAMPVHITLQNRGLLPATNVVVNYRVDSGMVVTETIGLLPQQSSQSYTFARPADLSATGLHLLQVWLTYTPDTYPANNSRELVFRNLPLVKTFPHLEDFEKGSGGWFAEGTNTSWQLGTPSSPVIHGAASGKNSWKTNLAGNYNANELSYLYTGCYDLTHLQKPVISISAALNTDSCIIPQLCDLALFQYSTNGKDWRNLLSAQPLHNWPSLLSSLWYNRWHVMSQRLPDTLKTVRFRFQFRSNGVANYEGIALDDLHLYDSTATIYDGPSVSLEQTVNGIEQWVEFRKDGKLLAALQPRGQNLGSVKLQTFINKNAVRNFHGQDYLDRNFVWQTANPPSDSIGVRLYFTDQGVDSLLFAPKCAACTKPANAYRFGVNVYTSSEEAELDSSIANNRKGAWTFIANRNIKTVPFANGYYVEFSLKEAGELRLSNGGLNALSPLPVIVENVSAERNGTGCVVQWQTAAEINMHHFDIEVANGNTAFAAGQFEKIGEKRSGGQSAAAQAYSFTETLMQKNGVRYYRIKSVDTYGNATYTHAVPVFFSEELSWKVYPNPSTGKFNLVYQSSPGALLQVKLYNSIGELIKEMQFTATGFVQQSEINLEQEHFAKGIYYLRITDSGNVRTMKVIRQ